MSRQVVETSVKLSATIDRAKAELIDANIKNYTLTEALELQRYATQMSENAKFYNDRNTVWQYNYYDYLDNFLCPNGSLHEKVIDRSRRLATFGNASKPLLIEAAAALKVVTDELSVKAQEIVNAELAKVEKEKEVQAAKERAKADALNNEKREKAARIAASKKAQQERIRLAQEDYERNSANRTKTNIPVKKIRPKAAPPAKPSRKGNATLRQYALICASESASDRQVRLLVRGESALASGCAQTNQDIRVWFVRIQMFKGLCTFNNIGSDADLYVDCAMLTRDSN